MSAQQTDSQDAGNAVIIPAFNEAGRIGGVLRAVLAASLADEVIVVCDGCSDDTAAQARAVVREEFPHKEGTFMLYDLPQNMGKGGAMTYGAHRTNAPVLLFLDADLIGLKTHQVDALLQPMVATDNGPGADMTLGLFGAPRGGIFGRWLGFCHRKAAILTGQRAIRREVFLTIPELTKSRFGVEVAITRYVQNVWKLNVQHVRIDNVTHPVKEEKIGLLPGLRHRLNMYGEIVIYLILDTLRNATSSSHRQRHLQIRERLSDDS